MKCIEYVEKLKREGWKVVSHNGNNVILLKDNQLTYVDLRFDTAVKAPSNATTTTPYWNNPLAISASDNQYAIGGMNPNETSGALIGYNFGFSVSGTIKGISVSIEKHATYSGIELYTNVYLGFWDGSNFTTKGSKYNDSFWNSSDETMILGSSSDLWGASWTPSDINSSQFAVKITIKNLDPNNFVQVYIDYVSVTITYTPPAPIALGSSIASSTAIQATLRKNSALKASVVSSSVVGALLKKIAALQTSINGVSIVSAPLAILKSLLASINGSTQTSFGVNIQKALNSVIQSSTTLVSDLIVRGKQLLNAIISTSTSFVSNLNVQHTLASIFSGNTQVSSFMSVQKDLQGSISGQTIFVGTIDRIKQLVSNITTQTILTAQLIVPRLLSALISGGTSFTGQIQRLRTFASQVIGQTTIQAQLISVQLLQAVISSTTHMSALLKREIKMFASFVGSTIFVAVPTFWNRVKKPTAVWRQKSEEVGTWRRIK